MSSDRQKKRPYRKKKKILHHACDLIKFEVAAVRLWVTFQTCHALFPWCLHCSGTCETLEQNKKSTSIDEDDTQENMASLQHLCPTQSTEDVQRCKNTDSVSKSSNLIDKRDVLLFQMSTHNIFVTQIHLTQGFFHQLFLQSYKLQVQNFFFLIQFCSLSWIFNPT